MFDQYLLQNTDKSFGLLTCRRISQFESEIFGQCQLFETNNVTSYHFA